MLEAFVELGGQRSRLGEGFVRYAVMPRKGSRMHRLRIGAGSRSRGRKLDQRSRGLLNFRGTAEYIRMLCLTDSAGLQALLRLGEAFVDGFEDGIAGLVVGLVALLVAAAGAVAALVVVAPVVVVV